jgi:DNA repair exonuclease SbcCD ATPase subunit
MKLQNLNLQLQKLNARYQLAKAKVKEEHENFISANDKIANIEQAQRLIQRGAQTVQQQAHKRIASVVSKCLESILDEPYDFRINFERKRGKTEARLVFYRDGIEFDPLSSTGGGVVDIAAFALRVACIMLERPAKRRLLVLDEPFKFVSEQYRDRIRLMLETLAEEMQVQFIIVTHIDELKTGTIIDLGE